MELATIISETGYPPDIAARTELYGRYDTTFYREHSATSHRLLDTALCRHAR